MKRILLPVLFILCQAFMPVDNISFTFNYSSQEIDLPLDTAYFVAGNFNSNRTIVNREWREKGVIIPSNNDGSLHLTNLKAGKHTYVFTATNTKNFSVSDSVKLIVYPQPVVNTSPDTTFVGHVNNYTIKGAGFADLSSIKKYEWAQQSGPQATLSNQYAANLNIAGLDSGVYVFRLTITSARDKSVYKDVTITVKPSPKPVEPPPLVEIKPRKIYAVNDDEFWVIKNIEQYPDLKVDIINEQGKLIFSTNTYNTSPWKGDVGGKGAGDGAYFYIIRDKTGRDILKGSLLVVR